MLKNSLKPFRDILDALQKLELDNAVVNRRCCYIQREKLDQDIEYYQKLGFEIKLGNHSIQLKINGKQQILGTYRGPYKIVTTNASLPYTGIYDQNLERWITKDGKKVWWYSVFQ